MLIRLPLYGGCEAYVKPEDVAAVLDDGSGGAEVQINGRAICVPIPAADVCNRLGLAVRDRA